MYYDANGYAYEIPNQKVSWKWKGGKILGYENKHPKISAKRRYLFQSRFSSKESSGGERSITREQDTGFVHVDLLPGSIAKLNKDIHDHLNLRLSSNTKDNKIIN